MKKGFTLLELLVVISIIGILSGISFSAMKSGGKSLTLSRATHSLATEIRKAQEMAMAMKKMNVENYVYERDDTIGGWLSPRCSCDSSLNVDCPIIFPAAPQDPLICYDHFRPPVIGIPELQEESYIYHKRPSGQVTPQGYGIYIQKTPLKIYLFADTSSPYDRYNSGDTIVENFCQSEKDICQGKINIVSFSPSGNELHIVFKPPHPTTVFYPSSSEVSITLGVDSLTKTIKVFKSGLISVE